MLQNDAHQMGNLPHFGPKEIVTMAMKLVAEHGSAAGDVAMFFAEEHQILEDMPRFWAWHVVACTTEDILAGRHYDHEITIH